MLHRFPWLETPWRLSRIQIPSKSQSHHTNFWKTSIIKSSKIIIQIHEVINFPWSSHDFSHGKIPIEICRNWGSDTAIRTEASSASGSGLVPASLSHPHGMAMSFLLTMVDIYIYIYVIPVRVRGGELGVETGKRIIYIYMVTIYGKWWLMAYWMGFQSHGGIKNACFTVDKSHLEVDPMTGGSPIDSGNHQMICPRNWNPHICWWLSRLHSCFLMGFVRWIHLLN